MKKIDHHHKAIIGLAGFSGSGKTTLAEKLIKLLSDENINIGSIKHAHHNFEVDKPGKDSWRHRKAGSNEVIISSSKRIVHIKEKSQSEESELEEILKKISPKDLVIIEGFKKENFPKIEVFRDKNTKKLLLNRDQNIIALATDKKITDDLLKNKNIPILHLNNAKKIKDFILQNCLSKNKLRQGINSNKKYVSFFSAIEKIKKIIKPIRKSSNLPLVQCSNKVLAKSIFSKHNLPSKDNAAVDGFGFAFKDYNSKSGSLFPIFCTLKAGLSESISVPKGYAIRIFTGAVLPKNIDTIAMQENCKTSKNKVFIPPNLDKGLNHRPVGENLKKGELIISSGKKLNSSDLGLLASSGYKVVPVINNLNIGIISTGNEIIKPGEKLKDGLVYDSNGLMLYDLVAKTNNRPKFLGILKDKAGDNKEALKYYEESISLQTDPYKKAKILYKIAVKFKNAGRKSSARNYARKTLNFQPSFGRAYLLISNLYASSANDCGETQFNKRAVYWLAAQMAYKASEVDASIKKLALKSARS